MRPERFATLNPGDIVRGIHSGDFYVITGELGKNQYIGTRTIIICKHEEWDLKQINTTKPDPFDDWFYRQHSSTPLTLREAFEAGMKAAQ